MPRSGSKRSGSFHSRRKTSCTISSDGEESPRSTPAGEAVDGPGVTAIDLGQGVLSQSPMAITSAASLWL